MIPIASLVVPILVSAALVWVASALVWMVLPHHKKDFAKVPDEDAVRAALRGIPAGQYNVPHFDDPKAFGTPEAKAKFDEGPCGFLTMVPTGMPSMPKSLVLSLVYYLVVGTLTAYVAGLALAPGADYHEVFRLTSTVAFLAYGLAYFQDAVWFGRPWSQVVKLWLDALLYGILTGGVFGWLWP